MGFVIAPLAFALIIYLLVWQVAGTFVGDVTGYGSALLLKTPPSDTTGITPYLSAAEPGTGTKDTVNITQITFPTYEQVYGEIAIENRDVFCPLVYGDTEQALKKGAGQYTGSMIVGYPGTTLVCAHVNRQFANLHTVEVGDTIQVRTTYGVYTYEVKYTGVHKDTDDSAYDLSRKDENLVLYTCYYQGSEKLRLFVCADYVSGPMIVDWGGAQ